MAKGRHGGGFPTWGVGTAKDPGVFAGLPPDVQGSYIGGMSPSEQADLYNQLLGLQQGQPQTGYSNQLGDLFYSLLGLAGYGGGGGRGGRGGGGGGGPAIDLGPQLGLERDKISWNQDVNNSANNNRIASAMFQQLAMNLQKEAATRQHGLENQQFLGSSAARGANTTAGAKTQYNELQQQFADLLKNFGYQQSQFDIQNAQGNLNYLDQTRQNSFAQQGLNIQSGNAGYQNPFNVPGPTPVQKKAV